MFVIDMGTVTIVALASVGGGLLSAAALVALDVVAEQRRRAREAASARGRRLHAIKDNRPVFPPPLELSMASDFEALLLDLHR